MWLLMPLYDRNIMSSTSYMSAMCTLQVLSSERHNTSFSLKVFVLKNSTFFMPLSSIRKRKLFTSRHSWLADSIAKCRKLAMWTCDHCLTGGKKCKVLNNCDKCEACVRLGVSCNLYISPEEIDKVSKEILQLEKEKECCHSTKARDKGEERETSQTDRFSEEALVRTDSHWASKHWRAEGRRAGSCWSF